MAKKIEYDELEQEFEDKPEAASDDGEEDESFEEAEQEELAKRQPVSLKKVTSPNAFKNIPQKPSPIVSEQPKPRRIQTSRFVAIKNSESYSIIDTENNQPILQSESAQLLILAGISDIMNRLDSLEKNLG